MLAAFSMFCCVSGCSSLNKPKGTFDLAPRRISIRTEPQGANVTQLHPLGQSPTELGSTPINDLTVAVMTNIKFNKLPLSDTQDLIRHANNVIVRITKDGYEPYMATIHTKAGKSAVLNIRLGAKSK